jgi:Nuclease-related domain
MRDGRWVTVTESAFLHERAGLEFVKNGLPDAAPYRAWSNFTFTANTGHVREVDLLVAAPSGLYLLELKDWHGRLETAGSGWLRPRRLRNCAACSRTRWTGRARAGAHHTWPRSCS